MNKKIHNFDLWNEYLDNSGNILKGKFQFCLKDTTTPIEIYDKDGTPIDNPILTDIRGRTNIQVFLPDEVEVTVYVYKYIGNGILENDVTNKEELWELQYTINLVSPSVEVEVKDATRCPSIEALKNASEELEYVTLIGYYKAYDTEPVNYYWDSESMEEPDGGSVIAKEGVNKGRWKLVTTCYKLCSTHFGIFPSNSINNNDDQSLKIKKFIDYCNEHGLHPLFDGNKDYRYYNLKDIDLIWHNDVFVNEYVQFIVEGKVNLYGEIQGSTTQLFHKTIGSRVKVTCKEGYTAWGSELYCSNAVHFNGQYQYPTRWSGITCYIEKDISGQVFDQCNMVASKVIQGENAFENMAVKEVWFTDDSEWQNIEPNCILDISDWPTTSKWIHYRNEWNNGEYGDLQGRTIDDALIQESYISASNFTTNGKVKAPVVKLSNATINVIESDTVQLSDVVLQSSLTCNDLQCSNVTNLGDFTVSNGVNMKNTTVVGGVSAKIGIFENSTMANLQGTEVNAEGGFVLKNVTVTSNLNSLSALNMVSCNVGINLTQSGSYTSINTSTIGGTTTIFAWRKMTTNLLSSTFNNLNLGYPTLGESECIFTGVITNCYFSNPININHSVFDNDDRKHSYVFQGNTTPKKKYSTMLEWENRTDSSWTPSADTLVLYMNGRNDAVMGYCLDGYLYQHLNSHIPLDIFAIGTTYVKPKKFRMRYLDTSKFDWNYVFAGVNDSNIGYYTFQNPVYSSEFVTTDEQIDYMGVTYTGSIGWSAAKGYFYVPISHMPTNSIATRKILFGVKTINIGELGGQAILTYSKDPTHYTLDYEIEIID